MELNKVIKNILDGNAMLIMGAGASSGATNSMGEPFPSGSLLAKELYKACGENNDSHDLADASELYKETFSPRELIAEIRTKLSVGQVQPYHEIVYSLPWIRYYTTNYDDIALISAKKAINKQLTPITLNHDFRSNKDSKNICVHINGYIGDLSEDTLDSIFKLTSTSYLSTKSISEDQWGALLREDLEVADNIVIIGLSLTYDLELSKLIYNSNIKSKTIFIDAPDLDSTSQRKLERFGRVYKIGISEFARNVKEKQATYQPRKKIKVNNFLYSCFLHEYKRSYSLTPPTPQDVFDLFMNGSFADSLVYEEEGKYFGIVYRKEINDALSAVSAKRRVIFLHADLGNGKTTLINILRHKLSREDVHIFCFQEAYQAKLATEVSNICKIDGKVVVIIEDYFNYLDILKKFSCYDMKNLTFVLTARSAINEAKMIDACDILSIQQNESVVINLNKLNEKEIVHCSNIFSKYGIYGDLKAETDDVKIGILKNRNRGNKEFQSILIDIAKSNDMIKRIDSIVTSIKGTSRNYYEVLMLSLVSQTMKLRFSIDDINRIIGVDVTCDVRFRSDSSINELLLFNNGGTEFRIKSAVSTNLILQKLNNIDAVISVLIKAAKYASMYSKTEKYNTVLVNIVSYSHINSFLRGFSKRRDFLLKYYDELSQLDYYSDNLFFWLQYAIACIEILEFARAQKYIDVAFGFASSHDKFVPFQINNQQARLYLECIKHGKSRNVIEDFDKAHKLLMLPIVSPRDNEENVVKLFSYYCHNDFRKHTEDQKEHCKNYYKEAYNRLNNYIKKHSSTGNKYVELKNKLFRYSFI